MVRAAVHGVELRDQGAWLSGSYGNWDGAAARIRPMDVNGDGKQDIVIGPDANGKWYVLLCTGSSFVNQAHGSRAAMGTGMERQPGFAPWTLMGTANRTSSS